MFEDSATSPKVSKQEFATRESELRNRLLKVQRRLRETNFPVLILISGVEGAGKGSVVNRLN